MLHLGLVLCLSAHTSTSASYGGGLWVRGMAAFNEQHL